MDALEEKIAHIAATRLCRYCSQPVPPEAVICLCRIERGEIQHTDWEQTLKRFLCVRTVERRMWTGCTEQSFWERMVTGLYAGTAQGGGANRIILPMSASVVDCFPYAAGDSALWAASGYPTPYTI